MPTPTKTAAAPLATRRLRYEILSGTRLAPGAVLAVVDGSRTYRCGGPATECLRIAARMQRQGVQVFFRKAVAS